MSTCMNRTRHGIKSYFLHLIACSIILMIASCHDEKSEKSDEATPPKSASSVSAEAAIPVYDTGIVTVAKLTTSTDKKSVQVIFDQWQAFYTLQSANKNYSTILAALNQSLSKQTAIRAVIENKTYNIENVLSVSAMTADSLAIAAKANISASSLKLLDKWDSAVINRPAGVTAAVGCTSPITLTQANTIFTACASQSCTLIGPPTPCIPFQYVRDGCYARAHKMAAIIASYGYCVNKVFSFANQGSDQLAVRATYSGGKNCCVTWWYHVAPTVIVQTSSGNIYYVIDPGMFTGPVTLATWLGAQANTTCSVNAKVSAYRITDPNYYQPANYAGTLFNTDPSYINTNYTLAYYRYFVTCP